jgi:hypothetical protein
MEKLFEGEQRKIWMLPEENQLKNVKPECFFFDLTRMVVDPATFATSQVASIFSLFPFFSFPLPATSQLALYLVEKQSMFDIGQN